MKRLLVMFLIFAFTCIFSGCNSIEFNIEDTINPPVKESVAVQGTWKIVNYISVQKEQKDEQKTYVGKEAVFDNELSAIGSDVCINPEYKLIRTSADTFVQSRYRIEEESLGLKKQNVNVITITADNQLFYELIVTDEMTAYVYFKNGFLVLNKISDTVDEKIKESSLGSVGVNIDNGEDKEDPILRSGVLIGIRSADNTYRTLFIYSKNREIKAVSSREQMIVPRAKGFWKIGTIKSNSDKEIIYAEPFVDESLQEASLIKTNLLTLIPGAEILFTGNDYIGIEHNSRLNVLSIDNLNEEKGLALSDFINDSYNAFQKSSQAFISSLNADKAKNIINEPDEENFTLKRRNGHWILKSRLYYKEPAGDKKYEDFDLNLMVPSKLIHYDEMNIPWNEIKSKLPWTTDAYMSPNKDIAILVSGVSLNIYPVQNKSIINKQLMKIPLSKGDSIVMAEWSIGRYADIWATFTAKSFTTLK